MEKEVKKYRLTDETRVHNGVTLHRVEYLRNVLDKEGELIVAEGSKGGWLEHERNLDHRDGCVVLGDAVVMDRARVWGNAIVTNNATVKGYAEAYGNAIVTEHAIVGGYAEIDEYVCIGGHSIVVDGYMTGRMHLLAEGLVMNYDA